MKVLLTGGGTAGHINPALAIAEIIKRNAPGSEIAFVGVRGGREEDLVPREGYRLYFVRSMGIHRSLSPANLKALFLALHSPYAKETLSILEDFSPDLVIGTGGYASWPIMSAAARKGIPTAIHESNALPGLTVKRLQKKVDAVWVNFEKTKELLREKEKTVRVGNPLREDFSSFDKNTAQKELGIPSGKTVILSFGGSLGAEHLNEAVLRLMKDLSEKSPDTLFFHASGNRDAEKTKKDFLLLGLDKRKNCFLTDYFYDMPKRMAAADLVICRAGAMTLSELARMKKCAILVPSPYVADDHQYKNAKTIADAGGAEIVTEEELAKDRLKECVERLCSDSAKRAEMEKNIGKFADTDPDRKIWREICKLTK